MRAVVAGRRHNARSVATGTLRRTPTREAPGGPRAESRGPIVVAGDPTLDWKLAVSAVQWPSKDDETHVYRQDGGAFLLAELIEETAHELAANSLPDNRVCGLNPLPGDLSQSDHRCTHYFATFRLCSSKTPESSPPAWRITEFNGRQVKSDNSKIHQWETVKEDPDRVSLVLLDDMGLGFRNEPSLWPKSIRSRQANRWIMLKMASPVATGPLWDHLHDQAADQLIVVIPIEELRRSRVQVSQAISWESTAEQLSWALLYNPSVRALRDCAYVVVSFGPAGAVLFSREAQSVATVGRSLGARFTLVFDPGTVEGTWQRLFDGSVFGRTHILVAAIARQLMLSPECPDLAAGILSGLHGMDVLYRVGFGMSLGPPAKAHLAFPTKQVVSALSRSQSASAPDKGSAPGDGKSPSDVALSSAIKRSKQFAVIEIPDPDRRMRRSPPGAQSPAWTILRDTVREDFAGDLYSVAEAIVLKGATRTLGGVPLGHFGKLLTLDRQEIEGFRSIQTVIDEYDRGAERRPLSIAVFGPPGSGKSFGITQIARQQFAERVETYTFNLSQFGSHQDLLDALMRVGTANLDGKLPLVFWDEFDSAVSNEQFGWVRHFLVPMQDGAFQVRGIRHPIGRAIFVFAGGIFHRIEEFLQKARQQEGINAKLPDFESRLRGYLNVRGLNPDGSTDAYYIVRRATILRSLLERWQKLFDESDPGNRILNIDDGVLRAFLTTREFRHGARSMEAIVSMSLLAGQTKYEQSCLPPDPQLNLHVIATDFVSLMREIDWSDQLVEVLAERVHQEFRKAVRRARDQHPADRPYSELSADDQKMNRLFVEGIHSRLESLRYQTLPRPGHREFAFSPSEVDGLAREEHERYVQVRLEMGWEYAKTTDWPSRRDSQLLPWDKTSDARRREVKALVRAIPRILWAVGYTIVPLQPRPATTGRSRGNAVRAAPR